MGVEAELQLSRSLRLWYRPDRTAAGATYVPEAGADLPKARWPGLPALAASVQEVVRRRLGTDALLSLPPIPWLGEACDLRPHLGGLPDGVLVFLPEAEDAQQLLELLEAGIAVHLTAGPRLDLEGLVRGLDELRRKGPLPTTLVAVPPRDVPRLAGLVGVPSPPKDGCSMALLREDGVLWLQADLPSRAATEEAADALRARYWQEDAPEVEGPSEPMRQEMARLREAKALPRLLAKDVTLWSEEDLPELGDRLGWLDLPETSEREVASFVAFRKELQGEGFTDVLLLGMGGSSLAPLLVSRLFPRRALALHVLDTTHPKTLRRLRRSLPWERTLVLVSSKSGTTAETLALFAFAWQELSARVDRPGRHFAAITDPGTPLASLAEERGFRSVFLAPPTVGGRYSALSVFGLLPATLHGTDAARLLAEARAFHLAALDQGGGDGVLQLAAWLSAAYRSGRTKLTFIADARLLPFAWWLEQLLAESTGKDGKGMLPVVGEPLGKPSRYGDDRAFVTLTLEDGGQTRLPVPPPSFPVRLTDPYDLGAEFLRWEVAVALLGRTMGIHPFNQPDVEAAKEATRQALRQREAEGRLPEESVVSDHQAEALLAFLEDVGPEAGYIALQAYLPPDDEVLASLSELQGMLRDQTGLAVTAGVGPRFLHSTGQLHKGGPPGGRFVQILDRPGEDLPVPGQPWTFGEFLAAQAIGDARTLKERGRPVLRLLVDDLAAFVEELRTVLAERRVP